MSPLLPPAEEMAAALKEIWRKGQVTNFGAYHQALTEALQRYLHLPHITLFANGTLALMCTLKGLNITGEVITTPFTFAATAHALTWCGLSPQFVDIDPVTCTLDPSKIEEAIGPATSAILPVHVYGNPCNMKEIERIARVYNLRIIYDAAHAFGVEQNGESILKTGDASVVSFHATKVFTTIEGGAVACSDPSLQKRLDGLRNFGFDDETTIVLPGMNAKLDELRAACGWLSLKYVEQAIAKRKGVALRYREALREVEGISYIDDMSGVKHNYAYFPIFIDAVQYGCSRDELYTRLKEASIFCRRYFYPLLSQCAAYRDRAPDPATHTPVAVKRAGSVLCLPMHHNLTEEEVERVLQVVVRSGKCKV
jgi:dTDP-4-amino-4,6-dideoxygalactose transaminase